MWKKLVVLGAFCGAVVGVQAQAIDQVDWVVGSSGYRTLEIWAHVESGQTPDFAMIGDITAFPPGSLFDIVDFVEIAPGVFHAQAINVPADGRRWAIDVYDSSYVAIGSYWLADFRCDGTPTSGTFTDTTPTDNYATCQR